MILKLGDEARKLRVGQLRLAAIKFDGDARENGAKNALGLTQGEPLRRDRF